MTENYVYKKEVDWSLLQEGLTLPVENQVVFAKTMNRFLSRGESKAIHIFINGKTFEAQVRNVAFDKKYNRNSDVLQIRYSRNGVLARELQAWFPKSFLYITNERALRGKSRKRITLPDNAKEYIAIYTTEYDDTYIFEPITISDIESTQLIIADQNEQLIESELNFDLTDDTAKIFVSTKSTKIRKLNRKIGDNLKLLYGYRCQICGKLIGEEYGSHVVEAHHIDYFVKSLNNDAENQMILCPNHHRIVHDANPTFERKELLYKYSNGYEEKIVLDKHLRQQVI